VLYYYSSHEQKDLGGKETKLTIEDSDKKRTTRFVGSIPARLQRLYT
jgi:hypothetical protein